MVVRFLETANDYIGSWADAAEPAKAGTPNVEDNGAGAPPDHGHYAGAEAGAAAGAGAFLPFFCLAATVLRLR